MIKLVSIVKIWIAAFASMILVACPKSSPDTTQSTPSQEYFATVSTFDLFSAPVATFNFHQTTTASGSTVKCSVRNQYPGPLCVNFRIAFALNAVAWTFDGFVANLAANATTAEFEVSRNPARVDLAQPPNGSLQVVFLSDPRLPCPTFMRSRAGVWQSSADNQDSGHDGDHARVAKLIVEPDGSLLGCLQVCESSSGIMEDLAFLGRMDDEGRLEAFAIGEKTAFRISGRATVAVDREGAPTLIMTWTDGEQNPEQLSMVGRIDLLKPSASPFGGGYAKEGIQNMAMPLPR